LKGKIGQKRDEKVNRKIKLTCIYINIILFILIQLKQTSRASLSSFIQNTKKLVPLPPVGGGGRGKEAVTCGTEETLRSGYSSNKGGGHLFFTAPQG
jgi:hypothetical protein